MKQSEEQDPRVQIRDDVDPESDAYKKRVLYVTLTILVLSLIGGLWLGFKIQSRESEDNRNAPVEQQQQQEESTNGTTPTSE